MEQAARLPLIIDVDTGTDDAVCIAAATLCDEIHILGISAVCGDLEVDKTSRNTLDLVEIWGHSIPVLVGASKPLQRPLTTAISHGITGLGDVSPPRGQRTAAPISVSDLILNAAREHPGRLELLAVGLLTNLAIACMRYPELP